jgi:multicomponent Na+:H+ antiporter subunit G
MAAATARMVPPWWVSSLPRATLTMSWTGVADIVAGVYLTTGALLTLIAAIGLVRFPDLLSRMHSVTKPQVLGLLLLIIGLALQLRDPSAIGVLLLVAVAQLATAPVSSHMLSRASFRAKQVRADLLVVDQLTPTLDTHEEPRGAP